MILFALSSPPFYTTYVYLPTVHDPVPSQILSNLEFFPFFNKAVGAMDGTHINCCPAAKARHLARNCKGGVSQNTLACCSFDMWFQSILSGMDGCAVDASMYNDACLTDLKIPEGKYYLADAGFGICDSLLVPYCGVCYYLAEWGHTSVQYVSYIFSKQFSIFSIYQAHKQRRAVQSATCLCMKCCRADIWCSQASFCHPYSPPEYSMDIQAWIPPALAAMHNFIRDHNVNEKFDFEDLVDTQPGNYGILGNGPAWQAEVLCATSKRDQIASAMWRSYQALTQGIGLE